MAFVPSISTAWVQAVKDARDKAARAPSRGLTPTETKALRANGNVAASWGSVRVVDDNTTAFDASRVQRCTFSGTVHLGCFHGSVAVSGADVPCGVYDSAIADSWVAGAAVVSATRVVANVEVHAGAAIIGCGIVSCTGKTAFGNGMELPLGLDGPGRATPVFASISVPEAAALAQHKFSAAEAAAYKEFLKTLTSTLESTKTVVCQGARVLNSARVTDALICDHAVVDNATVERATLLSAAGEATVVEGGAIVRDALLQWRAHVDSMGCVEAAVMCEATHVDRHGKLLESLLGPMSGVSEGEVSASLVGPLVGFHHQALLIAALWPEGKGNVGYGANVGSNHTSKAPDQEIRPGEGTFFGLGTCVKFPANYQASPYTIVATGVCALPQRLAFPFSLVNTPGETIKGLSPAINELTPAWVLSDSVYTLWRNQHKFEARCTSKRHTVETAVFRPAIVDLMVDARERLANPKAEAALVDAKGKPVWTDRQIVGLGKNYMREASRQRGIAAYTRYIQLYALAALAGDSTGPLGARVDLCAKEYAAAVPAHPAAVLGGEFGSCADVPALIARYWAMMDEEWQKTRDAKGKDAKRGAAVIPDYNDVHPSADRDKVVLWMKQRAVAGIPAKL